MKGLRPFLWAAIVTVFVARVEAREYTFDFSTPRMDDVSLSAPSFAIGDTINLSLPEGQPSFSLQIVAAPLAGIAGQSYIAKDVQGQASAVVKPTKDGLRITVDDFEHQKIYSVRTQNGIVETSVHDTSGSGGDVCGTCGGDLAVPPTDQVSVATNAATSAATLRSVSRLKSAMLGTANAFPVAEQKAVIDILVAFDQGAKAWAISQGYNSVEDCAESAVQRMNSVLINSQLYDIFLYRLVGVVEVEASYSEINDNLLNSVRTASGALSGIQVLRNRYGADTVTLLINRTSGRTSGIGYEYSVNPETKLTYTSEEFDAKNYPCNVCDIKTTFSRYTMCHETGHNMGCGHSNLQGANSGPGRYSYSCGYHFTDAHGVKRNTIMAYTYTASESTDGTYDSVPYFSTPFMSPEAYGCPLGEEGVNNNRQTLENTYSDVAAWREHVMPYDWDVRFLDGGGNEIEDGSYMPWVYGGHDIVLVHSDSRADIYYTTDGTIPDRSSRHVKSGESFKLDHENKSVITACAVVDGSAQSFRTITINEGLYWSGESGRNGSGAWVNDPGTLAWDGSTACFDRFTTSVFPDIPECNVATVAVCGAVAPYASAFTAYKTSYVFEKDDNAAQISLRDASFAPSGDLTFNVPVKLDAVAFTNPASHTITFNAPFGQTLTETSGYCTNRIGIGSAGTLVVAPGAGKTQYFDSLSTEWFFSSARFCVGEGTVVFKGPADSGKGVFGNTGIVVGKGGNLVLDFSGSLAGTYSTIACEGTITFKAVATANSKTWWTDSGWRGTVAFEGLSADTTTQNFQFEKYGNANSKILLRNCAISYLSSNNAVFPGMLVLDGADALRLGNNGYSSNWNVIGALEGDGSISASSQHTQTYVFNTATNYTGSISIGATSSKGRRIVFGSVVAASDIPSQTAAITVKAGATASIGGDATWNAYHGVEIGGTLLVKGAGATLDCNTSAAMGLKLDDGSTLRFEAADAKLTFAKAPQFAAGTVNIAFAAGVAPTNGMVLVQWPDGTTPSGDFAFANLALAERFVLNKTAIGLVVGNAPLPATVNASITVRYWGDDGWEDRAMAFNLPTAWVTNYYPSLDTPEAVAAKYNETAANGATVWQCYMLGLDPTDATSNISLSMSVEGSEIRFAVDGLGETHELAGIKAYWYMKTSTNLVIDASFSKTRDTAQGLSPTFSAHPMPDTPTGKTAEPAAGTLFYKITVTFVAEDE